MAAGFFDKKVFAPQFFEFGRADFEKPNLLHFRPKSRFDRIEPLDFKSEFPIDFGYFFQVMEGRFPTRDHGDVGPLRAAEEVEIGGADEAIGFQVGDHRIDEPVVDIEVDEPLAVLAQCPFSFAKGADQERISRNGTGFGYLVSFDEKVRDGSRIFLRIGVERSL